MLDNAYRLYDTNPKAKAQFDLLIHMLKYGAEAQLNFHRNEDKLATDGLKEEYVALIKTDVPTYETDPTSPDYSKAVQLYNLGLKLEDKINIYGNFLFMKGFTNLEEYTIEIVHTKSDGKSETYYATDLVWDGSYYLTFSFNQIAPSQLRDEIHITLYHNGVAVTETYTRTGDMIAGKLKPELRNAILNFADCAKAYFG